MVGAARDRRHAVVLGQHGIDNVSPAYKQSRIERLFWNTSSRKRTGSSNIAARNSGVNSGNRSKSTVPMPSK